MTEFEEKMLQESKKQTAHLASIKASAIVTVSVVSILLGLVFVK